jgi:hypothetical protein
MANNPFRQNAIELLQSVADIQKDLGELNVAMMAQHSALNDLLPEFEPRYLDQMNSARVLTLKAEYEHRIRSIQDAIQLLANS